MTKRQGARAVFFLIILLGIIGGLDLASRISMDPSNIHITRRINEMYTDTADTWDGILLGTSYTDRAWAAPAAWEEYGMAVYPMSTDSQPFVLIPNMIEEVLKYQDISFAVVELHGLTSEAVYTDAAKLHRVTDNLKRSSNWINSIENGLAFVEKWNPEAKGEDSLSTLRLSFYFPLLQFHTRLTEENFSILRFPEENKTAMKGVYEAEPSMKTTRISLTAHDTCPEASDQQKELLDAVMECGKENNIALLFVNLATEESREQYQEELNGAVGYVREKGYPVLNLNEAGVLEESGIDEDTDYYDTGHMNALGAHKFTSFLAGWISGQAEVEDHRGDSRYQSWEDAAEYYDGWYQETLNKIEKWKAENSA